MDLDDENQQDLDPVLLHDMEVRGADWCDLSGDELDAGMHSGFMYAKDTDSESEEEMVDKKHISSKDLAKSRRAAVENRPEYQKIKALGLAVRPEGCSLGIHPEACVWRSYGGGSSHYGRSFGATSGRNALQALLRVIELMLQGHLTLHPKDRLAKCQLEKVKAARAAEPKHKD